MADKHLSDLEWKKFAKGRDVKDGVLIKALAGLDKATTRSDREAALAEIAKQSAIVRKAGKGDKALGDYLDEMDRALQQRVAAAKA